jgi:hypothetical protein
MQRTKNTTDRLIATLSEVESVKEKAVVAKYDIGKLLRWADSVATHPHLYRPSTEGTRTFHFYRVVL